MHGMDELVSTPAQDIQENSCAVGQAQTYMYMFLLFECTGYSLGKTIQLLNMIGHSSLDLKDFCFTCSNVSGYHSAERGNYDIETRNPLREETKQLSFIKWIAIILVRNVFFETAHTFATIDDDIWN